MTNVVRVIMNPKYIALTLMVTVSLIAFAAWLPNIHLITRTMNSSAMTIQEKANVLVALLGSLQTNFTTSSRWLTITSAFLAGTQVSLLTYHVRQTAQLQQTAGISFLGITASLLGVGCASCGSVILTTVLGLGFIVGVLGMFPLKGQEFSILGVVILVFAIKQTIDKINQPGVCKVNR